MDDTERAELVILLMRLYACRSDIDPKLREAARRGADKLESLHEKVNDE